MEVDKIINDTGQQIRETLSNSHLTLGIMELILKDVLNTVLAQKREEQMEAAMMESGAQEQEDEAESGVVADGSD